MKKLFIIIPILLAFMAFGCINKEAPIEDESPKVEKKTEDAKKKTKTKTDKPKPPNPPPAPPAPEPNPEPEPEQEPGKAEINLNLFIDKFPSKVSKVRFRADLDFNTEVKEPYKLTMIINDKNVVLAPEKLKESEKSVLRGEIEFEYTEDEKPFLSDMKITSVTFKSDSAENTYDLTNDFVITEKNIKLKLSSPASVSLTDIAGIKAGELKYAIAAKGVPFISEGSIKDFDGSFAEIPIPSPTANNEDLDKLIENAAEKIARFVLTTSEKKDKWEMRKNLFVTPSIHTSCAVEVSYE